MAQKANAKKWIPAIYARLSDEDRENKTNGVSLSIDHQIDILQGFVKDKGWQEPKVFMMMTERGQILIVKAFKICTPKRNRGISMLSL